MQSVHKHVLFSRTIIYIFFQQIYLSLFREHLVCYNLFKQSTLYHVLSTWHISFSPISTWFWLCTVRKRVKYVNKKNRTSVLSLLTSWKSTKQNFKPFLTFLSFISFMALLYHSIVKSYIKVCHCLIKHICSFFIKRHKFLLIILLYVWMNVRSHEDNCFILLCLHTVAFPTIAQGRRDTLHEMSRLPASSRFLNFNLF